MEPFRTACLHALDVPAGKSSTRFISSVRAVDRLPADLRKRIKYLQVINTAPTSTPVGARVEQDGADIVAAAHPIIATHPVTGQSYITANPLQTDCVLGMSQAESSALLEEIYRHFHQESEVYEHFWKNGDLIIWDNLAVHHARGEISQIGNRTLRRLSVGYATYEEQMPARWYQDWIAISRSRQQKGAALEIEPSRAQNSAY
jgi:taurine dioxygenase